MIEHHEEARPGLPRVFNSTFETGVRAIFLLVSIYPDSLDLEDLVALDHLVVHSEDVGGPNSLHPATATHATEMLVRRELIRNGLLLMQTRSMIERVANESGICYRAGDEAHNFVAYLTSQYFHELRRAATYLASLRRELGKFRFEQLVEHQLERWAIQFQSSEVPGGHR
jgi:ABC-3C biological conflict system middle component